MNKLYNNFHHLFNIVPADNASLLESAYRLRYQVYCLENHYEDKHQFPGKMELDEYDVSAAHTLIQCKASGQYAGLVRLILPDAQKPDKLFPIEKYCELTGSDTAGLRLSAIPRESLAEVSRVCISKEVSRECYKRPKLEIVKGNSGAPPIDFYTESLPHIILGLISGFVRMSVQNSITHCLAVLQPALIRLLSHFGIHFHKIGPLVEYHGQRQPVICALDEILTGMYEKRRDVWEITTNYGEFDSLGEDSQLTATGY